MIVISHATAFLYWRTFMRRRSRLKPLSPASGMTQRFTWTPELAKELAGLGIVPTKQHPLHLLFAAPELRPTLRPDSPVAVRPHVQPETLPPGSILRLSEHVAIVSPELCFLQMAGILSLERGILTGYELCGTYALLPDPENPAKTRQADRPALTTVADLAAILTLPIARRNLRARRALTHIIDGAASPMESKVAMLLCLPATMGGYGLPHPELNPELPLSAESRTLYRRNSVRPDLYWREARMDVEYDGDIHEGDETRQADAGRRAALEAEGAFVLVLTYAQVANSAAFDVLARRIGKAIGASVRIRMKEGKHPERQAQLRRELEIA